MNPTRPPFKNPGLWIDHENALDWARHCRTDLIVWLSVLAGGQSDFADLSVYVEPPTQDRAAAAFSCNNNLTGNVRLSWGGEEICLRLPMPFHGVFLSARPGLQTGLVSVWRSWLGEAPGLRLLQPAAAAEAGYRTVRWRMGLPEGRSIEAKLENIQNDKAWLEPLAARMRNRYYGDGGAYPESLRPHLALYGLSQGSKVEDFLNEILALSKTMLPTAEDDLDHRILITFPVWLKQQISRELLNAVLKRKNDEDATAFGQSVMEVLTGKRVGDVATAHDTWAVMQKHQGRVANRIEWAINGHMSKDGIDHADYVDPINPLDLVSRITRVRRIPAKRSVLALIGPARRQNLPSFKGKLCPLESPESELVGLTLQLASGASVDFDGRIQAASDPAGELGFGARLVPFLAHNDGTRNMMGAKNLRQAVPLRRRQAPVVRTGGEQIVDAFTRPLVQIGLCPDANAEGGGFGLGRDLLVAYLPWRGMNFEDAIVVGEHVITGSNGDSKSTGGLLDLSFTQSFRKSIPRGWAPADPVEQTILSWSKEGLATEGTELFAGSPIANMVWEGKAGENPLVIRHEVRTPAILRRIHFSRKSEWTDGVLEYEMEMPIPLKPGDKLMGRHGNKGVVGAILPTNELPRLPNSECLPEHLRGRPIDILLNPHGVISRMNLGQLIETHLGWLLYAGRKEADFRKNGDGSQLALAEPFADTVDHDKVQELLEASGLDRYGRICLQLPDGTQTISPVVVGFQHIVRLRHIPEMKSQARRGDQSALYSARTGQAARGRKLGGGQRIGEMEMWALAAHQAHTVIAEIQGIKSSAELVAQAADADSVEEGYTGYRRVLQDWLFALLIKLDTDPKRVSFGFATEEEVLDRAGHRGKVTSPAVLTVAPTARFRCRKGGERKPCECTLLDGVKIAFPTTSADQDAKAPVLCLGDLLARFELRANGPLVRSTTGSGYEIPLIDLRTRKPVRPLRVNLEPAGKHALKGSIAVEPGHRPPRWPETLDKLNLYGQFGFASGANWLAADLLDEFMKSPEIKREERRNGKRGPRMAERVVEEMRISCTKHESTPLSGVKPFGKALLGEPAGLFDPLIFGSGMPTSTDSSADRWGVIELPFDVPYPKGAFSASVNPKDPETRICPLVKYVPVLPAHYRVPGKLHGDLVADPLDRLGYAPLVQLCQRCEEEKAKADATLRKLEEATDPCGRYANKMRNLWAPQQDIPEVKIYLTKRTELQRLVDTINTCQDYKATAEKIAKLETGDTKGKELTKIRNHLRTLLQTSEECRHYAELEEELRKLETDSDSCLEFVRLVQERELELRLMEEQFAECLKYAKEAVELREGIRNKFENDIKEHVESLFRMLAEALGEKTGIVRRDGLGRRVDRSARLVVVPNPELEWDCAGIPVIVLLELMGDQIGKWLDKLPAERRAGLPELQPVSWLRPRENAEVVRNAQRIVEAFLREHPDFVVLLNRQPSLHRESIQAFHPVPLPPEAGEVIQLCPLACKGFAADFDGDEMVVHLPLGYWAQMEAKTMLPTANLFSMASEHPDNVMAHFDQDFVMGTWLLGEADPVKLRSTFLALLPEDGPLQLADTWGRHPSKRDGLNLLARIAERNTGKNSNKEAAEIIAAWMRVAFEACTRAGISFGYYDIREIAGRISGIVSGRWGLPDKEINKALDGDARSALAELLADGNPGKPGHHFASLVLSGARGEKQVRQIVAARGLLDPGSTAFEADIKDFIFHRSLVEGLSSGEAYNAAMNARSSMCDKKIGTAYAGGLTRSLVFALWDYRIVSEDCGNDHTQRNAVTCREMHGCCAKCYGSMPDGQNALPGFPAGLIAAQSIGERGTQLSMQSFHVGESALNIQWVRFALGLGTPPPGVKTMPFAFADPEQAQDFVRQMKEIKVYGELLDRHFQILWRTLYDLGSERKLSNVIKRKDPITRLAHRAPAEEILTAAMGHKCHSRKNPFAEVLFGTSPYFTSKQP